MPPGWVLGTGLGGGIGDVLYNMSVGLLGLAMHDGVARGASSVLTAGAFTVLTCCALGIRSDDVIAWTGLFGERVEAMVSAIFGFFARIVQRSGALLRRLFQRKRRRKPSGAAACVLPLPLLPPLPREPRPKPRRSARLPRWCGSSRG